MALQPKPQPGRGERGSSGAVGLGVCGVWGLWGLGPVGFGVCAVEFGTCGVWGVFWVFFCFLWMLGTQTPRGEPWWGLCALARWQRHKDRRMPSSEFVPAVVSPWTRHLFQTGSLCRVTNSPLPEPGQQSSLNLLQGFPARFLEAKGSLGPLVTPRGPRKANLCTG